jgi:type I restriction enzyme, S subunit
MSNSVSNDWSEVALGEHAYVKARIGWRGLSSNEYTESGAYLIAGTHIKGARIEWEKCDHIDEFRYEESPEIQLKEHDVVISKDGTIGRLGYVENMPGPATINGTMMLIRPDSTFYPKFVYFYLQGDKFQKIIKEKTSGSSVPHIFQRDMVTLLVPRPPLSEQQKVSSILSSVDDVIEKTRTQIDKLKDLKIGMMQELWSKGVGAGGVPHTEFKESPVGRIPITWNVFPLEQLVRADRTITYGIVQAGPHYEAGVPYIRVSDMTRRHLSLDGMLRTSPEIAKKYKRSSVSPGDIVYALRGVIGHVHVVPPELDGANLTQGTARLSPNDSVHARYLLWAMKSPSVQLQNDLEAKGSTFKEVTLASLRKLQIAIPSLDEQSKIASIMDSIERKLHGSEDKLEHLQSLKKALMQDLLTGKVRVKVDQKESAVA